MITTFESFSYNEELSLTKDMIEKALKHIQKKMPYEKFVNLIKRHRDKISYLLKKYTNGKDTVYSNKILVNNEGFRDSFFYEFFIEPFTDGFLGAMMCGLIWLCAIGVAVLMYFLGVLLYLNFIYTPMDRGVIQNVSFRPAHTELVAVYTVIDKTTIVNYIPMSIPDTWNVKVKEIGGDGIEGWETSNRNTGDRLSRGDTISWNDAVYNVTKGK